MIKFAARGSEVRLVSHHRDLSRGKRSTTTRTWRNVLEKFGSAGRSISDPKFGPVDAVISYEKCF